MFGPIAQRAAGAALTVAAGAGGLYWADGFVGTSLNSKEQEEEERKESRKGSSSKPLQTKLLVVGGGILGASLTYETGKLIKKQEKSDIDSVILLDRSTVGSEASGLSAGTIECCGSSATGLFSRLHALTTAMIIRLNEEGYNCDYVKSGALQLAVNETEKDYLESRFKEMKKHGCNVELLSAEQAVQLEPALKGGSCVAAIHTPESGYVDPSSCTHAFVDAARDQNVRVLVEEGAEVVEISKLSMDKDFNYQVKTKNGLHIECEKLAICAGAWTRPIGFLLGVDVPVFPVKGQIWLTEEVPKDFLRKVIYVAESGLAFSKQKPRPGIPMHATHDLDHNLFIRHAYGRPNADGQILFGGGRLPCKIADGPEALYGVEEEHVRQNQNHVYEFLPSLKNYKVEGSWAGPMPFSMDGLPIVGSLRSFGHEHVWILSGAGPHGVMEGPGVGKVVAQMISKQFDSSAALSTVPEELCLDLLKTCDPAREGACSKTQQKHF